MRTSVFTSLLLGAGLSAAAPIYRRTVTSLDQAATAEAQQIDNTATRALTGTAIKVGLLNASLL